MNTLRDALVIFHKESGNLFRDRRAVFSNFVMPLFLMPLIMLAIGSVQGFQARSMQETVHPVQILGKLPAGFEALLQEQLHYQAPDAESSGEDTVILEFPEQSTGAQSFVVTVKADLSSTTQSYVHDRIRDAVQAWNKTQAAATLGSMGLSLAALEPATIQTVNLAKPAAQDAGFLAVLLPYLLVLYLASGPLGLAIQATAGEKEQGGLSAILVNQVSRQSIALGKVGYVVVAGLLNAVVSLAGLTLAMFLLQASAGESAGMGGTLTGVLANGMPILALLAVMLCTSAMMSALMVCLGAMAKNMKEAAGYTMPVMMLAMIAGVATMSMDPAQELAWYAVPVLNSIFSLKLVMLGKLTLAPILITLGVNSVVAAAGVWLATRLYSSERILNTV